MSIREDFYKALREQYQQNPEESFLFSFLREERLKASAESKGKRKRKGFDSTPLDELLGLLSDRHLSLRLREEDREWLCGLGERAGDAQLWKELERTTRERAQYQLIKKALEEHPEVVREEELRRLRGLVLDAMVMQDARAFLYDAGFPVDEEQKGRKESKKDRMLTMMDEWGKQTHHCLSKERATGADELTVKERTAWGQMFRLLQRSEETTDIVMPVRVDPLTGAGLYLVGVECYTREDAKRMRAKGQKCAFVCLLPSDVPNPDEAQGFYLYLTPSVDDTITCVSLKDGEKMLAAIKMTGLAYEFFKWINGEALPETPELLQEYFLLEGQSLPLLAEEGRRESAKDRKRRPTRWGEVCWSRG